MTDGLGDLFVEVTGEESTTEHQVEEPSKDPIDEAVERVEETAAQAGQDGLSDAVDGAEADGGSAGDGGTTAD